MTSRSNAVVELDGNRITDLSPLVTVAQSDGILDSVSVQNQAPTLQCATSTDDRVLMRLQNLWRQFNVGSGQKDLHVTGPDPKNGGPTRMYDTNNIVWKVVPGQTAVPVNVAATTKIGNATTQYSANAMIPLSQTACPMSAASAGN